VKKKRKTETEMKTLPSTRN